MKSFYFCLLTVFSLFTLISCGQDFLLDEGTYFVTHTCTYTSDPLSDVGETFEFNWDVKHVDDKYAITVKSGGEFTAKGKEYDNEIVLIYQQIENNACLFTNTLRLDLDPSESGTRFKGQAMQTLDWCAYYNPTTGEERRVFTLTVYEVSGKKIED